MTKMLSNIWQEIIVFYNGDVLSRDVGLNHRLVKCDIEFSVYFNPQISIRSREKTVSELQLKIQRWYFFAKFYSGMSSVFSLHKMTHLTIRNRIFKHHWHNNATTQSANRFALYPAGCPPEYLTKNPKKYRVHYLLSTFTSVESFSSWFLRASLWSISIIHGLLASRDIGTSSGSTL